MDRRWGHPHSPVLAGVGHATKPRKEFDLIAPVASTTDDVLVTAAGYERLRAELDRLQTVRCAEIGAQLREAREDSDPDNPSLYELLEGQTQFEQRIVGKQDYLDAMPTRTYELLESEVTEIHEREASAVVTVIVDAAGKGAGGRFEGRFRNTRVFVNDGGHWLCRMWVNVPVEAG